MEFRGLRAATKGLQPLDSAERLGISRRARRDQRALPFGNLPPLKRRAKLLFALRA